MVAQLLRQKGIRVTPGRGRVRLESSSSLEAEEHALEKNHEKWRRMSGFDGTVYMYLFDRFAHIQNRPCGHTANPRRKDTTDLELCLWKAIPTFACLFRIRTAVDFCFPVKSTILVLDLILLLIDQMRQAARHPQDNFERFPLGFKTPEL